MSVDHIDRKIAACERAYRAGNLLGAIRALELCTRYALPLPPWASAAARDAFKTAMNTAAKSGGRHAKPIAEIQANAIHYARWSLVKEFIEKKALGDLDEGAYSAYSGSLADAFAAVAAHLSGTKAAGEPSTIRDSYRLVQKAMRGDDAARFLLG